MKYVEKVHIQGEEGMDLKIFIGQVNDEREDGRGKIERVLGMKE